MVESYLDQLQVRLRRRCGRGTAGELIREARAHLSESIDELKGQGLTQEEAEREALERFGTVQAAERALSETRGRPGLLRSSVWPVVAIVLCWLLRASAVRDAILHVNLGIIGEDIAFIALAWSGLLLVVLACFKARRWTSPVMLVAIAVLLGLETLWTAATCVAMPAERGFDFEPRAKAEAMIRKAPENLAQAKRHLDWLVAGHNLFYNFAPLEKIPDSYRVGSFYKLPMYDDIQSGRTRVYVDGKIASGLAPDFRTAHEFWASTSALRPMPDQPSYVSNATEEVNRWEQVQGLGPTILRESFTFRLRVLRDLFVWNFCYLGVIALIGDALGAGLRGLVRWHRKIRGQRLIPS